MIGTVTDTLVTALGNVTTRLLIMEPLAIAAIKANTYATKRWVEFVQAPPFWCNRVGGVSISGPEDLPEYEVTYVMRLILDFKDGITRLDDIDSNAQDNAAGYIASTIRYFEQHRMLDAGSAYPALSWVAPRGTSISCPVGLDLKIAPLSPMVYLAVEFNLIVPLQIGASET